jgi:rubredoxin---NAD+ reductase
MPNNLNTPQDLGHSSYNTKGEWSPPHYVEASPFFTKPFSLDALKWVFNSYLKAIFKYMLLGFGVYYFLTPDISDLANYKHIDYGNLGLMYLRNVGLMLAVYGSWHLSLYTLRLNGSQQKYFSKWQSKGQKQFLFSDQTLDNMFYTLVVSGLIWTVYEYAYLWSLANGHLESMSFSDNPIAFIAWFLIIPFWRPFHFYWVHRLIHWKPLYTRIHALHHRNINIGPWSGMAMHPVEGFIYISVVGIHWLIACHPVHFFYNLLLTTLTPAGAHSGFEGKVFNGKTSVGDYAHFLHHRYFHYNFGDIGGLPMDKWFGTLYDGSDAINPTTPYKIKETEILDEQDQTKIAKKINRFDTKGVLYKIWQCTLCAFVYDEALGLPKEGIAPGTRWEDIPEDWECPDCGISKAGFDMIELAGTDEDGEKVNNHVVIVGSGLAGYTLAKEIRKTNPNSPISLFTKDNGDNYSKPMLSNALTMKKSAKELILKSAEQTAIDLNINLRTGIEITRIDRDKKELVTEHGVVKYDKLVLALGGEQIVLPFSGNGADSVLQINNLKHYEKFRKSLNENATVTIIGGGLIGCEFANDLILSGYQVNIIDLAQLPLSRLVPDEFGERIKKTLADLGINWSLNSSVKAINKVNNKLICSLSDGNEIQSDIIISAIGLRPNVGLAQDAGLSLDRGIKVDATMATSDPDIFAIGDCAQIGEEYTPYIAPILHAVKPLAKTLCGIKTKVIYPHMPIVVKTPSCPLLILAPRQSQEGKWHVSGSDIDLCAKFIDHKGVIQGFALMGTAIDKKEDLFKIMNSTNEDSKRALVEV